jgi:hypothetical protein
MWPTHVQGPVAQTLIKDVTVVNLEGTQTFDICIFGERHYTNPCPDEAFDVGRDHSGRYDLLQGINPELWTIARLLYILAISTQKRLNIFLKLLLEKIRLQKGP